MHFDPYIIFFGLSRDHRQRSRTMGIVSERFFKQYSFLFYIHLLVSGEQSHAADCLYPLSLELKNNDVAKMRAKLFRLG